MSKPLLDAEVMLGSTVGISLPDRTLHGIVRSCVRLGGRWRVGVELIAKTERGPDGGKPRPARSA